MEDIKYFELLAEQYKNANSAITEMINLQAIVNLPKGTEHFLSDIHGEFEPFYHILKNASGAIRMYIEEIFGQSLSAMDKKNLAIIIYYPEERIDTVLQEVDDKKDFFKITLFRLVRVLKRASTKYTRSKVRKVLPKEYAYILEELIHEDLSNDNKTKYYTEIISTIVEMDSAREFIVAISKVIQTLVIDRLHIIGDIFDRGKNPDKVMDLLCTHHSVDIQWGNHDISWIGANAGSRALICTVIRLCAKHNNLELLEDSYGINLVPLVTYAMEMFKDDECTLFYPSTSDIKGTTKKELSVIAKIHKAITILEFKEEEKIIRRRPEYEMESRLVLNNIDFDKGIYKFEEKEYMLKDSKFQTISKNNPYDLTLEEENILHKLQISFMSSDKLTRHIKLLMKKGSMYTIFNQNLLFHGCVPMTNDGEFRECVFLGENLKGKDLIEKIDKKVRKGYFSDVNSKEKQKNIDLMWYLWCGQYSPLFGKDKMATFENYYVDDVSLKKENKDPYYSLRNDKEVATKVLEEFELHASFSKIINGHVPVEVKKGENPVKADGRLIVIDGGLTKAYHKVTGIAGYTLISNSVGLYLAEHEPFTTVHDITQNGTEFISNNTLIERYQERVLVKHTDNGKVILKKIEELNKLINAYKKGLIRETL